MKTLLSLPRPVTLAAALLGLGALASAQELAEREELTGWFVRLDAAARFNLKASMKTLPLTLAPGVYDNGSVLPDVSGTASGLTWNWSYQSASQISYDTHNQPQALVLQRFDYVPTPAGEVNFSSPMLEGEVIGGYRFGDFSIGRHKARLGLEIGYGYFASSREMNFQAAGQVSRTVDTYNLGGIVPPVPPYAGTFHGPGPLIDLNPSAHLVEVFPSTTTFQSSFDATFHNFRVGPSFGIDLSRRLELQIGAGYDSVLAQADLRYRESSVYNPNPDFVYLKTSKWRLGFYTEILFNFRVSNHVQVFLGGDFTHNSDFVFGDGRHEFTFQLGSTYAGKGGFSYSF